MNDSYIFRIDRNVPAINLNIPGDDSSTGTRFINFNWTSIDNLAPTMDCNVTLESALNRTGITVLNNTVYNYSTGEFPDGDYYWNVSCWDLVNNTNTSPTYHFTVTQCIPPTFGDWFVNITCNISNTEYDVVEDVYIQSNGNVNMTGVSNLNFTSSDQEIYITPGGELRVGNGSYFNKI